jgi:TolB-like protein/Tfp pilus assembly protein PilF
LENLRSEPDMASGRVTSLDDLQDKRSPLALSKLLSLPRAGYKVRAVSGAMSRNKIALVLTLTLFSLIASIYFRMNDGGKAQEVRRIAVLPFDLESDTPNSEFLSEGLTETLMERLSRISDLQVVGRGSVFQYKGKDADPQTVCRALDAQAVLTGKLTRQGGALLVSLALIDARDNRRLWSEEFEGKVNNIQVVENDMAVKTAERLRSKSDGGYKQLSRKRETEIPEAYDLYLMGRYHWNKSTENDLRKAVGYFNQAIDLDPSFASAYAGLSETYSTLASNYSSPSELIPLARAFAEKAVELDNTLPEAHFARALNAYLHDWDWKLAEKEFKTVLELSPNHTDARMSYGGLLRVTGRMDEAITEIQRSLELDPLSLRIRLYLGITYYLAKQYDRAMEQFRIALERDPNLFLSYVNIGRVYIQKGQLTDAVDILGKAREIAGDHPLILASLGQAYAASGNKRGAKAMLEGLFKLSAQRYIRPYEIAKVYASLGDKMHAVAWLERGFQEHSSFVLNIDLDPSFEGLRSEPGFQDLINRIGSGR